MKSEYYDIENSDEAYNRICTCGHELYRHGFTDHIDYMTNQHYFWVSQCTVLVEGKKLEFCKCKEFNRKQE